MDLRLSDLQATDVEREAVDRVCRQEDRQKSGGHVSRGGVAFSRSRRPLLLDALWSLQEAAGCISRGGLDYLCVRLGVAPADAYGVASAYALFSNEPQPAHLLHVCDDIACMASGAVPATHSTDGAVTRYPSPCLGHCEYGSAGMVQSRGPSATRWTIAPLPEALDITTPVRVAPLIPRTESGRENLRLLKRVGVVDPDSLVDYRGRGGYEALSKAFALEPGGVIAEVKAAKLLGRGGAAFPTGVKWQAVHDSASMPHYFVCNADESEPGTFKDRVLMENDPFAVVEALTVAGFATRSACGYVYIRGEYPLAEARIRTAVEAASASGLLGANILGSGFDFTIRVQRGAGAYIAGEETALFNSIEGKRPEPRNKPPFPTEKGLFGQPTGANNVETLLNVLDIMVEGGEAFTRIGTEDSTGTRLFCVSGAVDRPGLYELPMGSRLPDLLDRAGASRQPLAVLMGGAAGVFMTPEQFDVELSFEGARSAGITLGSGVVIMFDEGTDFNAVIARIVRFFRDESCGQCVPCRVGTVRQEELVGRMVAGELLGSRDEELHLLSELAMAMKEASICGLGQTATSALESALRLGLFPDTRAANRIAS